MPAPNVSGLASLRSAVMSKPPSTPSLFPVKAHALAKARAEIRSIDDDPELRTEMESWAARRAEFMAKFDARDPATLKAAWQRFYFKGEYASGGVAEREHRNKLRVADPVDLRDRRGRVGR